MILFSACCICGLIGGILNFQFVRALNKRPDSMHSIHLAAMTLACLGKQHNVIYYNTPEKIIYFFFLLHATRVCYHGMGVLQWNRSIQTFKLKVKVKQLFISNLSILKWSQIYLVTMNCTHHSSTLPHRAHCDIKFPYKSHLKFTFARPLFWSCWPPPCCKVALRHRSALSLILASVF